MFTEEKVDHPSHYNQNPSGVECIDVVEHLNFNVGNAMKYLWRHGLKDMSESAIVDLRKAKWYVEREIQRLEKKQCDLAAEKARVPVLNGK